MSTKKIMSILVSAIAMAVVLTPSALGFNEDDQTVCIENGDGEAIQCVRALARQWLVEDGHVQGWCFATDADESGDLTCTEVAGGDGRSDVCLWNALGSGCSIDLGHHDGSSGFTVDARGCVGILFETGPFSTNVAGNQVEFEGTGAGRPACTTATAAA